jgi:hypothetical protein
VYETRVQSLPDGTDGQNHTNFLSNRLNSVVGSQLEGGERGGTCRRRAYSVSVAKA